MSLMAIDGPVSGPSSLTVGTTAVELKVGASKDVRRKAVAIQPLGSDIYFGFDNSVTTSTGFKIFDCTFVHLPYKGTVDIYLISPVAGVDVRISELG